MTLQEGTNVLKQLEQDLKNWIDQEDHRAITEFAKDSRELATFVLQQESVMAFFANKPGNGPECIAEIVQQFPELGIKILKNSGISSVFIDTPCGAECVIELAQSSQIASKYVLDRCELIDPIAIIFSSIDEKTRRSLLQELEDEDDSDDEASVPSSHLY